jgi:hypothetical protein
MADRVLNCGKKNSEITASWSAKGNFHVQTEASKFFYLQIFVDTLLGKERFAVLTYFP